MELFLEWKRGLTKEGNQMREALEMRVRRMMKIASEEEKEKNEKILEIIGQRRKLMDVIILMKEE